MRTRPLALLAPLAVLPLLAPSCQVEDDHPDDYELVFADEFDGDELDRDVWCTRYVYGGGPAPQVPDAECQQGGEGTLDFLNDEQQRYVDTNAEGERMHDVADGVLRLRATRTRDDGWASYESAMIRSKELFRPTSSTSYWVTARVRMPDVVGTWPAFWLNSDRAADGSTSWPPEIDVIDAAYNGRDDRAEMLHQSVIIRGAQTSSGDHEYTFTAPEFDTTWSNYHADESLRGKWVETAVEWTDDSVCWFVDGYKTACENYRWAYDGGRQAPPAHVLLNLAVGGSWAGRYGVDDTKFPTAFEVDHVRIYRKG